MRRDTATSAIDDELVAECLSILDRVWPRGDASRKGDSTSDGPSHDGHAAPLESFGRFELYEARGQGGYGLVFRAYDTRLRREVALKVPRPDVLATRALRARFLREAQAAAALDHPNIVPVLDAGEEGPLWYIVTAYCPGPTLAEWLEKRGGSVDPHMAAWLVAELADGVHHAHFRGVLHRDLKPSNVLLEPTHRQDADGRLAFQPRITDFGLAKRLDDPGEDTRTGMILGTLRYMSPEQAAGRVREIGVASDVYALGAILYELLRGEVPFLGDSDAELIRSVLEDRPQPLRCSRRGLSKDLETICLKCLEKRADDRYASAAELAADLRRYVRGEPVSAMPLTPGQRVQRWARRRPGVAVLCAAVIALTLSGVAGIGVALVRERGLRREAESAKIAAQERTEHLRRAADDFYSQFAERVLARLPGADPLREEFLRKGLAIYQLLSSEEPNDPQGLFDLQVALHRMANIQFHLSLSDEGRQTRRRCLQVIDKLLSLDPENVDYRFARFHNVLCLAHELADDGERRQAAHEAHAMIRALAARDRNNPMLEEAHVSCALRIFQLLIDGQQLEEARRCAESTLAHATELTRRFPDRSEIAKSEAACWEAVATANEKLGHLDAAIEASRTSLRAYATLAQRHGADPRFREFAGVATQHVGRRLVCAGRHSEALHALKEGEAILARLSEEHPDVERFQIQRQRIVIEISRIDFLRGHAPLACVRLAGAIGSLQSLATSPESRDVCRDILGGVPAAASQRAAVEGRLANGP